jgi:hypothetical protein
MIPITAAEHLTQAWPEGSISGHHHDFLFQGQLFKEGLRPGIDLIWCEVISCFQTIKGWPIKSWLWQIWHGMSR